MATTTGCQAVTNAAFMPEGGEMAFEIKQHNKKTLEGLEPEKDLPQDELKKLKEYTDAKRTYPMQNGRISKMALLLRFMKMMNNLFKVISVILIFIKPFPFLKSTKFFI